MVTIRTRSAEDTMNLGERLGRELEPGDVVALYGELGSGKTTLTKGLARGLGVPTEVFSPTFTLIHEHPGGRIPLYHVDLYRLEDEEEVWNLGIEDYLYGNGVTIIEWAERMPSLLPEVRLDLKLVVTGDEEREISMESNSERLRNVIEGLAEDARACD